MRNIFVAIIVLVGIRYTFQAPIYALLFYIWNAYFRPEQWLWSDWISSLNLSFIVGIYLLVAVLFSPAVRLRFSRRNVVFLLFGLHCIVSMLLSDYTEAAWPFMQEFLKVLIISYLITTLVDDLWKFRLTLLVLALSLGLEQAKQGWGNVIFNPGSTNNNPIPFLGDNNGVAIGMLMLVPLFMALLQTAGKHWERHVHRMSAIGVAIRAIVTLLTRRIRERRSTRCVLPRALTQTGQECHRHRGDLPHRRPNDAGHILGSHEHHQCQ